MTDSRHTKSFWFYSFFRNKNLILRGSNTAEVQSPPWSAHAQMQPLSSAHLALAAEAVCCLICWGKHGFSLHSLFVSEFTGRQFLREVRRSTTPMPWPPLMVTYTNTARNHTTQVCGSTRWGENKPRFFGLGIQSHKPEPSTTAGGAAYEVPSRYFRFSQVCLSAWNTDLTFQHLFSVLSSLRSKFPLSLSHGHLF